eukprot:TRINITY_DN1986_c0_g1_i2.p1 TRINITY_DN1986_c0_g1~~TRINITY_DN1986_c0_g1_i2.p1  ORF type:complete len:317 (+),score=11.09 TRINITY_DN1986_c0_g1_i2:45-953(+)
MSNVIISPEIPQDINGLEEFKMQKAEVKDDKLVFKDANGFGQALSDGVFLIKIPDTDLAKHGDLFRNNFYLNKLNDNSIEDEYRGFKQLYLNRFAFLSKNTQVEYLSMPPQYWSQYYPQQVVKLLEQMLDLAIVVLKNVLRKVGIDEKHWDLVTSGACSRNGFETATFNHYNSKRQDIKLGSSVHQDAGFCTILRCTQPGLMVLINNQYYAVNGEEGYFVVNFGRNLEYLTNKSKTPVKGCVHGVIKMPKSNPDEPDRTSLAVFTNPKHDGGIYSYEEGGKITFLRSIPDFYETLKTDRIIK